MLLIGTYRPEFDAPWIGRPHVTTLTLNRLGEREIAQLIDRLLGNKPLPESIRHDIIERTDGVPLFVEEMTKAVLEAAGEGAIERAVGAVPSPSVAVPASLQASLMARLDRLGSAKQVAQVGAVIGREFSHSLLAAVAGRPELELQSALDRVQVCYSGRARRLTPLICSSTHWYRMQLTARCCENGAERFMLGSRTPSKRVLPILRKTGKALRGSRVGRASGKILAHGGRKGGAAGE
jgi:hypothetical protein